MSTRMRKMEGMVGVATICLTASLFSSSAVSQARQEPVILTKPNAAKKAAPVSIPAPAPLPSASERNPLPPALEPDPVEPSPVRIGVPEPVLAKGTSPPSGEDPEAAAAAFMARNRREAETAIQSLESEAEVLRRRLRKVESGLARWRAFLESLPAETPAAGEKKGKAPSGFFDVPEPGPVPATKPADGPDEIPPALNIPPGGGNSPKRAIQSRPADPLPR